MIAMALSCEPKLLIADEPTTALDVTIQAQILALLDDLKHRLGMAMLLITHDMGVIAGHADRVNVMYAGRMVETTEHDGCCSATCTTPTPRPCWPRSRGSTRTAQQRLLQHPRPAAGPVQPAARAAGSPPGAAGPRDKCRTDEPPLTGETADHLFACWHPGGRAAAAEGIPPATAAEAAATAATALTQARSAERAADRTRWAADDAARAGNGQADGPLLEVRNLVKEFPVTSGAILQRKVGAVHAVSDVSFTVDAGRDLRAGRRVRLRQDHDRAG